MPYGYITDLFQNNSVSLILSKMFLKLFLTFMYSFSSYNILKKKQKTIAPENIKKTAFKSSILMAVSKYFLSSPDCPKQPRIEYPFHRFLYPMIYKVSNISLVNSCSLYILLTLSIRHSHRTLVQFVNIFFSKIF